MKKRYLFYFIVLLIGTVFVFADGPTLLKVKAQTANVRQQPDSSSAVVTEVQKGTELVAVGKTGNWYEISIVEKSGKMVPAFIHENTVEVLTPEEDEPVTQSNKQPQRARSVPELVQKPKSRFGGIKLFGGATLASEVYSFDLAAQWKQQSDSGFMAGIGFDFGGPQFGLVIEAIVAQNNSSMIDTYNERNNLTFNRLGVYLPILLKVRFMPDGGSPFLVGGGTVGYLISDKVELAGIVTDLIEDVNRVYYGITFGVGYELPLGSPTLFAEFRYNLGLSNYLKDDPDGDTIRNNTINLLLGIKF
jgi:hypothetical protein